VVLDKRMLDEVIQLRRSTSLQPQPQTGNNHDGITKFEIRQYSRLTVAVDDLIGAQALHINNEVLKPFDLIAAIPNDPKTFAYLCQQADIDIISIDFCRRSFPLNKKMVYYPDTQTSAAIPYTLFFLVGRCSCTWTRFRDMLLTDDCRYHPVFECFMN
jgi:hypothetical protein